MSEPRMHRLGRHIGPDLIHRVMIIKDKLVTVSKWISPHVFVAFEGISKDEATSLRGLFRAALEISRARIFWLVALGECSKDEVELAFELMRNDPTIRMVTQGMLNHVAKPEEAADLTMPEIGQKLLPYIVPRKLRAAVAGDLAEDFRTYATRWGRPYALRWVWWELAGLCIRRFGPTSIITAVGVWFRQKLGW